MNKDNSQTSSKNTLTQKSCKLSSKDTSFENLTQTDNNYQEEKEISDIISSQQMNSDSQTSFSTQASEEVTPKLEKQQERKMEFSSQDTIQNKNESIVKQNDLLDEYSLSQHNEQEQQNRIMISQQINDSLFQLSKENDKKIIFQELEQILQFCPSPINVDQSTDEGLLKYNQNIEKLKAIVKQLISWPIMKFNVLQSTSHEEFQQFQRNKCQLSERIMQHFQITYLLNKDDLGVLYRENTQNTEKLEDLKRQWEKQRDWLVNLNIQDAVFTITEFFQKINGLNEEKELPTGIEQLNTEFNSLKMECQNIIENSCTKYEKSKSICTKNENNLKLSSQKISLLEQQIGETESNINKAISDINKDFESLQDDQDKSLKQIKLQIEILNKKKSELIEKSSNEQSDKFRQLTEKINSLDNQICGSLQGSGGSIQISVGSIQGNVGNLKANAGSLQGSFGSIHRSVGRSVSSKSCFHYIYIVDESGSFAGTPHDQGIQGIMQSINNLSPQDFVSVIKFDSSATLKLTKTQKSSLDINHLKNSISNCASGGTSFMSAFTKLREVIQNNVDPSEYPIVVFITDGQDSTDLTSIIDSILQICNDLIFFSVGYGSINEKQLRSITDMFNKCQGQKRNINGKQLNLFFQSNTPEQLYHDILKINNTDNNKVSIEDIKKVKEFVQESFKLQQKLLKDFYADQENQIEEQLKILIQQQKTLQNPITKETIEKLFKSCLDSYNQQMKDLLEKKKQELDNQTKYINEIETEKLKLFMEFSPDANKSFDKDTILQNFNPNKLLYDKTQMVKEEYNKKLSEIQIKIKNIEKEQQNKLVQKKDLILKLGFQNESHFWKFSKLLKYPEQNQNLFFNIVGKYIKIIQQLIAVSSLVEKQIEFSKKNIEAMNRSDYQERVFKYYNKYDNTINPQKTDEAKIKVLQITNSSIFEYVKENNLVKFLGDVVRLIDFAILFTIVEKSKAEQEEFVETNIVPKIIFPSQDIPKLEEKLRKIKQKIKQLVQLQNTTQSEYQEEKDSERKSELREEIKEQKEEQIENKKEQEEIEMEIIEKKADYREENHEKIQVIKQVVDGFIKAIQDASLKLKYFVSIMPFRSFVETCQDSNKSLNAYTPLSIGYN